MLAESIYGPELLWDDPNNREYVVAATGCVTTSTR